MLYTQQEINKISSGRLATVGHKYIQENGYVWIGTNAKTLELFSIPDPNTAQESTLNNINAKTIISDTDNVSVIGSVLPLGASTEAKQNDLLSSQTDLLNSQNTILEELQLKGTSANQEINNLDNYAIISLLTNILKELKEQTKYLTKIYQ